jgi:crossover junction endodeoxyribonuclease RuvC
MILLGIDPASYTCGYGVLEARARGFRVVECGCIRAGRKEGIAERLHTIYNDVLALLKIHVPEELILEEIFFAKNPKSSLVLGEVRGVVILAAAVKQVPVVEISAKLVKKRITGNGNASKEKVQEMLRHRLNLEPAIFPLDASDALAIALAHGQEIHYV